MLHSQKSHLWQTFSAAEIFPLLTFFLAKPFPGNGVALKMANLFSVLFPQIFI
jgi:hypothetical protein